MSVGVVNGKAEEMSVKYVGKADVVGGDALWYV